MRVSVTGEYKHMRGTNIYKNVICFGLESCKYIKFKQCQELMFVSPPSSPDISQINGGQLALHASLLRRVARR